MEVVSVVESDERTVLTQNYAVPTAAATHLIVASSTPFARVRVFDAMDGQLLSELYCDRFAEASFTGLPEGPVLVDGLDWLGHPVEAKGGWLESDKTVTVSLWLQRVADGVNDSQSELLAFVLDENGDPLKGAQVYLAGPALVDSQVGNSVRVTDDNGFCGFYGVALDSQYRFGVARGNGPGDIRRWTPIESGVRPSSGRIVTILKAYRTCIEVPVSEATIRQAAREPVVVSLYDDVDPERGAVWSVVVAKPGHAHFSNIEEGLYRVSTTIGDTTIASQEHVSTQRCRKK
jgi:hypothetical protein